MSRDHDIEVPHHHCVECGGVLTGPGSIHPRCDLKAQIEVEVAAFNERRRLEDKKEEEERNARRRSKRFWN